MTTFIRWNRIMARIDGNMMPTEFERSWLTLRTR